MSKTVKVSKIEIELGDKTISLTLKEAKELQSQLDSLFGENVIERHITHTREPWWNRPYITCEKKFLDATPQVMFVSDNSSADKYGTLRLNQACHL